MKTFDNFDKIYDVAALDAAARKEGHITFTSMKQCADARLAVVGVLNKLDASTSTTNL